MSEETIYVLAVTHFHFPASGGFQCGRLWKETSYSKTWRNLVWIHFCFSSLMCWDAVFFPFFFTLLFFSFSCLHFSVTFYLFSFTFIKIPYFTFLSLLFPFPFQILLQFPLPHSIFTNITIYFINL